ncbi:hypothetical protein MMMB2_3764 [Mycobacterium marinum MB2]|nr:hypothetical protein MMSP_0768 [Mycobacterium sp. 012931]EPQ79101.1 hypothetical protein MMMB2_3764 [Mycobacterium marinum MB2]
MTGGNRGMSWRRGHGACTVIPKFLHDNCHALSWNVLPK